MWLHNGTSANYHWSVPLWGRKMRYSIFLQSKITKFYAQSKHKFSGKLFEEGDSYDRASISDRSKLLNNAPFTIGFNLFDNEKPHKDMDNVSLACKRFPSIVLGSSPFIKLYDETMSTSDMRSLFAAQKYKENLNSFTGAKLVDSGICETWPSPYSALPNITSFSITTDDPPILPPSPDPLLSNTENSEPLNLNTEKPEPLALITVNPEPLVLITENSEPLIINTENPAPLALSTVNAESMALNIENSLNILPTMTDSSSQVEPVSGAAVEMLLDKSISCLPGLSKKHFCSLEKSGFYTLRKLLHHFPRTYADLQNAQIGISDGQYLIFIGKVISSRGIKASYSFSFLEVVVDCEIIDSQLSCEENSNDTEFGTKKNVHLHLKKFFRGTRFTNPGFLKVIQDKHKEGDVVCVSGKVRTMRSKDHYEMREYNLDVLESAKDLSLRSKGRPYPIYPSKGGLNPKLLREIILKALQTLTINVDPIPKDIVNDFGLLSLHDAYIGIHQPKDFTEADSARRRLIFDEFFYLQLGRLFQILEGLGTKIEKDGLLDKYRKPELNAVFIEGWSTLTKKFLNALPYILTSSQLSAVSEIIWDLKRPVPMNRLLQGDVGCGKTVVAFLTCIEVIGSGYQAAIMVPTELLAVQHYEHFLNLLESMNDVDSKPSVALLTGSTPSKQSRIVREGLKNGDISIVIGTHSLISEKVDFSSLRIAVVDEQHRFGVVQRGKFNSKLYYTSICSRMAAIKADAHMAPHILAMSATPIPRTLALAIYGDMSITQITDLPPGRIPVETYIFEGNESGLENVYQMMLDELETGGKIYLVYPVIVPSEQLPQLRAATVDLETMSKKFKDYSCGILHGKMKSLEKDEALRRFRSGETHILLSTQVVEIGVDVPDASMMVVMNAERFGIAQLHQLRGRVGRGTRKSKCLLVGSTSSVLNRLKVLQKSSDGFHLANTDLLLRGPGDLLGKKQSGHLPEFPIARLEADGNILQDAHLAALKILGTSHDLEQFPALKAELSMRQPLCLLGD